MLNHSIKHSEIRNHLFYFNLQGYRAYEGLMFFTTYDIQYTIKYVKVWTLLFATLKTFLYTTVKRTL